MQASTASGWVPVGLDSQFPPASSHPVVVNGYGLAVWRGESGSVQVWEDRCPHRGMRLSFGFVRGDRLTCLYHGWEYEKSGKCGRIPAHPDLDPPRTICTKAYDSRTYRGIVFANLDGVSDPAFLADAEDDWLPVRSIFAAATADRIDAYLGKAGNTFGAAFRKDDTGGYVLTADAIPEVVVALQPLDAERTGIHVACRGADADGRRVLARKAIRMRRELEAQLKGVETMSVTTDPVALNQWIPCAWDGQIKPGITQDTLILGQPVRLGHDAQGSVTCHIVNEDGSVGRALPMIQKFELNFTTLGDGPRPLPEIGEFDESDRRIASCGSVGVNTSPFRVVENFLDMAHFCFVHTDVLGSPDRTEVLAYKSEIRRDVDEVWATDCYFFQPAASKSAAAEGGGQMTHYKYRVMSPFSVMLYKTVYGQEDRDDAIAVFIQPKTETECVAYMTMAIVDEVLDPGADHQLPAIDLSPGSDHPGKPAPGAPVAGAEYRDSDQG